MTTQSIKSRHIFDWHLIPLLIASILWWGYKSKLENHEKIGAFKSNNFLELKFWKYFGLLAWDLFLYFFIYKSILSFTAKEDKICQEKKDKIIRIKLLNTVQDNWQEFQFHTQIIRDVAQPKQLIYKISISTFINFAFFKNLFTAFSFLLIGIFERTIKKQDSHFFFGLKFILFANGIFYSTLFTFFLLREKLRRGKMLFLISFAFVVLFFVGKGLFLIGCGLRNFYHWYELCFYGFFMIYFMELISNLNVFHVQKKKMYILLR